MANSAVRDMLDLLHEDWLPESNKKDLQSIIIELIENMVDDRKGIDERFKY